MVDLSFGVAGITLNVYFPYVAGIFLSLLIYCSIRTLVSGYLIAFPGIDTNYREIVWFSGIRGGSLFLYCLCAQCFCDGSNI